MLTNNELSKIKVGEETYFLRDDVARDYINLINKIKVKTPITISYWTGDQPQNPVNGQYWWDPYNKVLRERVDNEWRIYTDLLNKLYVVQAGIYAYDGADMIGLSDRPIILIHFKGNISDQIKNAALPGQYWYYSNVLKRKGFNGNWSNIPLSYQALYVDCSSEDPEDYTINIRVGNRFVPINSQNKSFDFGDSDYDFDIRDENDNIILKLVGGHIITQNFNSKNLKKSVKILSIGDEDSVDAFAYVPMILENMGIDVTFGILYKPAATLTELSAYIDGGVDYDKFYLYTTEKGKWIEYNAPLVRDLLEYKKWDTVVLQQNRLDATDSSTHGNLNNIIIGLSIYLHKGVKFGWLINTPPVNETYSDYQAEVIESIFYNSSLEYIIPCGTAILLLRQAFDDLEPIGDGGNLTYDGDYLQEGFPRLLEAYTAVNAFIQVFNCDSGILGDEFVINDDIITEKNIPQRHGDIIQIDSVPSELQEKRNSVIAQNYAVFANRVWTQNIKFNIRQE